MGPGREDRGHLRAIFTSHHCLFLVQTLPSFSRVLQIIIYWMPGCCCRQRTRMIQLTFPLAGPSSEGAFKSILNLVNTYHVAGPGLIKTNVPWQLTVREELTSS